MRYLLTSLFGIIVWAYATITLHSRDLSQWFVGKLPLSSAPISTGQLVLNYLTLSPVKTIATLEVTTDHALIDEYFEDYKILEFDTPLELDKLISQMSIQGRVQVKAIYGYTANQIGDYTDPIRRWEPSLLYYEIVENNIEQVVAGLWVSSNTLVKRVVNVVLQGIHTKLKSEFATNKDYLEQAKQNALKKFR